MLVHPWAARDLKMIQNGWQRNKTQIFAAPKNPIFTGALGEYDGVILYEYERVLSSNVGAASANVCQNLLLGKQAACFASSKTS